jgi:tetratricopeptide (TPR) repeat protein
MITDSQQTSSPDIEAYLAMQQLKNGDRHAAIDKCHQAISQYGPNRNLYLVKARAHLELEEYGFAQEALLSLLSLDPEHPAGWALLGEAYYQLGNMPKVDYCRNRLKQIFPTLTEPDEEEDNAETPSGIVVPEAQEDRADEDVCRAQDIPVIGESEPRGFGLTENPVGQAHSGLDDIPAMASGIIIPEAQVAHISNNPPSNTENGEPAVSIVPLEEVADTQTPSEQPLSEPTQIPPGGIVDDLIATDLRINEQAEGTAKIDVEIFETATFADICLAQGKYEKALEIYTKLSMVHPDNAEYREKINSIQAKMGSR